MGMGSILRWRNKARECWKNTEQYGSSRGKKEVKDAQFHGHQIWGFGKEVSPEKTAALLGQKSVCN